MDGDAAEPAIDRLALAEVESASDVEAYLLDAADDGDGRTKGLRRLRKGREESVSGGVLFVAVMAL